MYIVSYIEPWDNGDHIFYGMCLSKEEAFAESEKFLRAHDGYIMWVQKIHPFEFGENVIIKTYTLHIYNGKLDFL